MIKSNNPHLAGGEKGIGSTPVLRFFRRCMRKQIYDKSLYGINREVSKLETYPARSSNIA